MVWMIRVTRSSSLSRAPCTPRPPRPWVRNCDAGTALTYPALVMVMTSSSSVIRSSADMSPSSKVIDGPAGVGELVADGGHLGLDDPPQHRLVGQDGLELGDGLAQLGQLLFQVGPAEPGQLRQAACRRCGSACTSLNSNGSACRAAMAAWPGPRTPGWRR